MDLGPNGEPQHGKWASVKSVDISQECGPRSKVRTLIRSVNLVPECGLRSGVWNSSRGFNFSVQSRFLYGMLNSVRSVEFSFEIRSSVLSLSSGFKCENHLTAYI